jgi:GT2 family glycosyltransferase
MNPRITIGIPSYQRPNDLSYLLLTIKNLIIYPDEIVIADDNSPDQDKISNIISEYKPFFLSQGINLIFITNKENLGYDKNLKVIITGGDAEFFDKKLKNSFFVNFNLTALGLNRILEYNGEIQ